MNSDFNEIEIAFFSDAKEQLEYLEMDLLNLESSYFDAEILNRIFRAVHTIKGSAGFAGFREVESFAHISENLIHLIREKELETNEEILEILLKSKDQINKMVNYRISGKVLENDQTISLLTEKINKLTIKETTVLNNELSVNKSNSKNFYKILLEFNENLFETGTNQLKIIEELSESFEIIESNIIVKKIPPLNDINIFCNYLSWQIIVAGNGILDDLNSIFMFISVDNNIKIEEISKSSLQTFDSRIGEILVKKGLLKDSEIEEAMKDHIPLGENLIKKGNVTRKIVNSALEEQKKSRSITKLNTIRINTEKLDEIIDVVGEVVVTKSKIRTLMEKKGWLELEEEAILEELERYINVLQSAVMKTRMVPVKETFMQFRRTVRDLSHQQNKKIDLQIIDEDTELDKNVIEKLKDPLKHMIRNSIDHGIELPSERMGMGKPEMGTLTLKAFHEGGEVIIEITDDGRGIDRKKILETGIKKGLISIEQSYTDEEILHLIFEPGFSTAERVTDISGRGVGMDVVKSNLDSIRGSISINSQSQKGTSFRINIPLTLAIIDGILIRVGNGKFIVPIHSVTEFLILNRKKLINVNKEEFVIPFRGKYVSVMKLSELFNIENSESEILMIIQSAGQYLGILIDEVIGKYQVVIKSLEENYKKVNFISGASILGNGSVAMILDTNALMHKRINSEKAIR